MADEATATPGADGTGAVLYGMFTSFTEALDGLDARLAAIEDAVRGVPPALEARLADVDQAVHSVPKAIEPRLAAVEYALHGLAAEVRESAERGPAATPAPAGVPDDDSIELLSAAVQAQAALVDERTAALATALDDLRALVQSHVDESAHSLGRRATDAGRRLVGDLGLRGRARPPD